MKMVFIPDIEVENINLTELSEDTLNIIEADTFWCTSKLLDGIQDNYTFAQPGIQTKVNALKELIKRIDSKYLSHLMGKPTMWFLNRSDINQAVQPQKTA